MTIEERSIAACPEYEEAAADVQRLTEGIRACDCPEEMSYDSETGAAAPSCFTVASELCKTDERSSLDDIDVEVAGCEACSKLVALIRERMVAKKRFSNAKRRVRYTGKAIIKLNASPERIERTLVLK